MPGQSFLERYATRRTTVAANTAEAAAVSDPWTLGRVEVIELTLIIPDGHAGLTGFAVEYDGVRIMPFGGSTDWVISNDEQVTFPVGVEIGHPLTIRAFNTDIYPHSFYTRARITEPEAPPAVAGFAPAALVL